MVKAFLFAILTIVSSFLTYHGTTIATAIKLDTNKPVIKEEVKEKEIMTISIPKLNISNKIYDVDSRLNNIDKNAIILKGSNMPDKDKGVLLIGAHSGTGKIAYFKNLNKIEIGDEIVINYNNKNYYYKVIEKYLDKKDGSINFNNSPSTKRLILYTCNPNDKNNFLVVICEAK